MKCQDFERLWTERLDARVRPDAPLAPALEAHASACPECRAVSARFLLLSQAIAHLPAAAPPAGFAERCLESVNREPIRPSIGWGVRLRRVAVPLAAAAAACVIVAAIAVLRPSGPEQKPVAQKAPTSEPENLSDALAHATSATWELALEASAPAARIGRDVLDSAVERPSGEQTALVPPAAANAASDVLQSVGQRVNEGVRPLSGSAKHAFGFLLGPALDDEKDNPRPS